MSNPEVAMTLREAVDELLGTLTGLDLTYDPRLDRFRAVTRALNKALRLNALEKEWSHYNSTRTIATAVAGESSVFLPPTLRPRMVKDDAVRLVDDEGRILRWAYFIPRDALHKYQHRGGLWASVVRAELQFSRPFQDQEDGLGIQLPVQREPEMFRLPPLPENPEEESPVVPDEVLEQEVDFAYPDVIIMRAAFLYAQTDPIMQPRVQTIEAQYKDLMYQVIERDERNTDAPYQNDWFLPMTGGLSGVDYTAHAHPHADERRL